ncbi:MAG: glycosyltransferase family 2 protein [Bacteroidales bacterium]|nr:glycosyltransferase family 2 protein [Bacteroidales bacterium]
MPEGVSIIIPCRNEKCYIESCIDSLINSDYPNDLIEIVIVDGMSDDGTHNIIYKYKEKYSNVVIIDNEKKITPVALNLGIKAARFSYIMIASGHSSYPENYISVLLNELIKLDAGAVGGVLETRVKNDSKKGNSIVKVLSNKFGVGNSMFRIGTKKPILVDTIPFGIYKREIFDQVGLYDERLIRNQDIEFSKRLLSKKKKLYLIPDISCYYYARSSFAALAKNNFNNGYWNILTLYLTKTLKSLSLRHYVPGLFVISLIIFLILSFSVSYKFIFIFLSILVFYNLLILYFSYLLSEKNTSLLYIFLCFIVLHFSYGFGSVCGLFRFDKIFK